MLDIVEKLKRIVDNQNTMSGVRSVSGETLLEAAGEIERLRAEVAEWKQAASVEAGLRRPRRPAPRAEVAAGGRGGANALDLLPWSRRACKFAFHDGPEPIA
jgi:hypothetical protein